MGPVLELRFRLPSWRSKSGIAFPVVVNMTHHALTSWGSRRNFRGVSSFAFWTLCYRPIAWMTEMWTDWEIKWNDPYLILIGNQTQFYHGRRRIMSGRIWMMRRVLCNVVASRNTHLRKIMISLCYGCVVSCSIYTASVLMQVEPEV